MANADTNLESVISKMTGHASGLGIKIVDAVGGVGEVAHQLSEQDQWLGQICQQMAELGE